MAILKIIGILLEVVLLFNLLIVVHELGHFLAAKWRGLVIEGFGIWFGKPIWEKKINGVTYSLGSIPAGGFVKLPQLMESSIEGDSEYAGKELPKLKPLDKIIVAIAGPVFSFGLACVFAFLVWQVGRPVTESERTTIVGFVAPGSPAETAGFKAGDEIVAIDGHKVTRWGGQSEDSVMWRIAGSEEPTIHLDIKRAGELKTIESTPRVEPTKWYQRRGLRQLGLGPMSRPMVAKTIPGSPAEKAGFLPNDILTKVGGEPIYDDSSIALWAAAHPGQPIVITVERGEKHANGTAQMVDLNFEPRGFVAGEVFPGSPAQRAGLQKDDRILAANGNPTQFQEQFVKQIWANEGKPVELAVERGAEKKTITVTPEVPLEGPTKPSIGIGLGRGDGFVFDERGKMWPIYPTPGEQISEATGTIYQTFKKLSPTSNSSISVQHMGGPVMMMRIYYLLFESPQGWRLVLWFSVVINVNLALMNMLPIPPLDGSHITLAIVEMLRGRPPGPRTQRIVEYIQTAGTVLVIGFMLFVTLFDVQDLFGGGKKPSMRFKPRPAAEQSAA
ncbi:MAG: regulator of sigma protease [Chthoniobacteraceae bacterium]|nr:regulator of sigma protease [Chthoniobacteraceae bacterium]